MTWSFFLLLLLLLFFFFLFRTLTLYGFEPFLSSLVPHLSTHSNVSSSSSFFFSFLLLCSPTYLLTCLPCYPAKKGKKTSGCQKKEKEKRREGKRKRKEKKIEHNRTNPQSKKKVTSKKKKNLAPIKLQAPSSEGLHSATDIGVLCCVGSSLAFFYHSFTPLFSIHKHFHTHTNISLSTPT